MSVKVLVISKYTDYHSTRPEASIFHGLAKLICKMFLMTLMDSKHAEEFEKSGITVIDYQPAKKFDRKESQYIRKFIIENDIDIVHLFNGKAIINGIRAARGLKVKVVLYRGYAGNINWWDPTAYLKFLHPRVDAIFCNSKGVEDYLRSKLICGKHKAVTINKGHDLHWYDNNPPTNLHKEFGIPEDAFVLINIANNRRMKGIPYLLEALNSLPEEANIHLLLVGRDMDTPENLAILKKGTKEERVHFTGFRNDVLNIVAASDVFVLPSIKGESITKSVIESMSLGTPAIISDIPGNVELVEDGKSGLVFPSKNSNALSVAILKLYNDRELCNRLGNNARKHIAENLSNIQTIEKTAQLYQQLLSI